MKLEKSKKVYSCCGQLYAHTNATISEKVKCPRCGKTLINTIDKPNIVIIKRI